MPASTKSQPTCVIDECIGVLEKVLHLYVKQVLRVEDLHFVMQSFKPTESEYGRDGQQQFQIESLCKRIPTSQERGIALLAETSIRREGILDWANSCGWIRLTMNEITTSRCFSVKKGVISFN